MLKEILIATGLVVMTVTVHAGGLSLLLRGIMRSHAQGLSGFRPVTKVVIVMTCWLILIHFTEVVLWGLFYYLQGCLPDILTAIYFSGGAYTTVGFGGVMLPVQWQIFALIETMTGILMCGLSTGFYFALVNQWAIKFMQRRSFEVL